MQIANVLVAVAGDPGNTVPKYGVTAAEIAVLRMIHGDEAVTDIEPAGSVSTSNRAELARLRGVYGGATDGDGNRLVEQLFPGAAARVFESLAELGIPEQFFKATGRMQAPEAEQEPVEPEPAPAPVAAARGRPPKAEVAPAPAPAAEPEGEADGISDMQDQLFN